MKKILTVLLMTIGTFILAQEKGTATYYGGKNYENRKTASGQRFKSKGLTCASSNKYKFGTLLEITNLSNGKTVRVVVNDRGSGIKGNKIDLSEGAFEKIANKRTGKVNILIKVLPV